MCQPLASGDAARDAPGIPTIDTSSLKRRRVIDVLSAALVADDDDDDEDSESDSDLLDWRAKAV
jgi:hypothetical protein